MNTLRLLGEEKLQACVTGYASKSLDWFVLEEEEEARCNFLLEEFYTKAFLMKCSGLTDSNILF